MRRVMIVGTSGVGKTTLAGHVARATGLPVVHLDMLAWRAGWVRRPAAEFERELDAVLAGDAWIVDGNYIKSLPERAHRADTLILIDLPLWQCLVRVFRRWWRNRGRGRPDLPEGCVEPLPWTFLKWVLSAPPRHQQLWHEIAAAHPDLRFFHLTNARHVADFVRQIQETRNERQDW